MFRNSPDAIVDQSAINPIEALMASIPRFPRPAEYATSVAHALESWPQKLRDLSFPSAGFELSPGEIKLLMKLWGDINLGLDTYPTAEDAWVHARDVIANATMPTNNAKPMPIVEIPLISDLLERIDTMLANMAKVGVDGPIFKLGTRSPKDSPFVTCSGGRVYCGAQVLLLVFTSSRMLGDIGADECYNEAMIGSHGKLHPDVAAELENVPPHRTYFWFRLFEEFQPWQEFRLVVRNGVLRGGTQYHGIVSDPRGRYFEAMPFPELVEHGYEYEKLIMEWLPSFFAVNPYDEAVVDVIVDRHIGTVTLLETNPYGKSTFPGLLDWDNEATLNGEVQWVAEPIRYSAPKISLSEIEKIREKCSMTPAPPPYESIVKAQTTPVGENMMAMLGKLFGRKK